MAIADLERRVQALSPAERRLFERIFRVRVGVSRLRPPEAMRSWIEKQFGDLDAVVEQHLLRVTNRVTMEEALFNPLRGRRPLGRGGAPSLEEALAADDPLAQPLALTPEDEFGRIEGRFCLTAANVAKADVWHALVIAREPHPLRFTRELVHDYLDVGWRWAQAAHQRDAEARYYLFVWNCLWRAGSSLPHGHAQVLLARDAPYARLEALRRAAEAYRRQHGADYFDDLYRVHAALGCAFEKQGVRVLAHLTPVKENETLLIASTVDTSLKDRLYELLVCYRDRLGVEAFNLALYQPPLGRDLEGWHGFPAVVRLVDRGPLGERTSDIGAMELYGASVVAADPFVLARTLAEALGVTL